jgi:H+/Cl- antiporter ClcA
MSEHAGDLNLERLLSDALRPVDPPETLSARLETTLSSIAAQAAAELSSWADELSEGELEALRDPRNWVRPVVAVAVGGAAAAALVVVEARRRRRPHGVRASAERFLRDLS